MNKKVCLITGASSGIGEYLAYEYAKLGYNLVLTGRRAEKLAAVVQKCKIVSDFRAIAEVVDVNDERAMKEMVGRIIRNPRLGRIDVVIANAGYASGGPLQKISTRVYRDQIETNVFGVLNTIYPCLSHLEQSKGKLALIGSVNSYLSIPTNSAYAMSKYALRALGEAITFELAPKGISVTMIYPGFIHSDIRQRDNSGAIVEGKKDFASRLAMPTDKAAKQIARAIEKRKKEKIITLHGIAAIYLKRFTPWLMRFLFRFQNKKAL
jgi:short-subunit dehydrogenase